MRTTIAAFMAIALSAGASAQMVSGPNYVAQAGASDLYERQSSELVQTSTADPKIKQIARDMVRDHTKSTADVKAAATAAGMKPMPPKLTPKQASDMSALRSAKGKTRDTLYVQQQKMAHDQALALHRGYAAHGDVKPLKAAAAKIAPVVEHHIQMLNAM